VPRVEQVRVLGDRGFELDLGLVVAFADQQRQAARGMGFGGFAIQHDGLLAGAVGALHVVRGRLA
jgi:hypothetical protein